MAFAHNVTFVRLWLLLCVGRAFVPLRSLARCDPPPSPCNRRGVVCVVLSWRGWLLAWSCLLWAVVKNSLMIQLRLVTEKLLSALKQIYLLAAGVAKSLGGCSAELAQEG